MIVYRHRFSLVQFKGVCSDHVLDLPMEIEILISGEQAYSFSHYTCENLAIS